MRSVDYMASHHRPVAPLLLRLEERPPARATPLLRRLDGPQRCCASRHP